VRHTGRAVVAHSTCNGSQNFLGARWVEGLVGGSPAAMRKMVALRLLSLSPHYFYSKDIQAEAERNRISRHALADALIAPHLTTMARVLDYGCGPGYMASAIATKVAHVDAVDISRGVLACAKALNSHPKITYLTPEQLIKRTGKVDLAYSFAVVQHLQDRILAEVLNLLANKIRPGGTLLIHFAEPGQGGWRSEVEWRADHSAVNKAKLRYGLNCFGRSADEMADLVLSSGFGNVQVTPLTGQIVVAGDDDVTSQHLLFARRL
jgi:SAM-dependent methyltransferase